MIDSQPLQMAEDAKIKKWQASLVVQGLGLSTFTAVAPGSVPGRGRSTNHEVWQKKKERKKERKKWLPSTLKKAWH